MRNPLALRILTKAPKLTNGGFVRPPEDPTKTSLNPPMVGPKKTESPLAGRLRGFLKKGHRPSFA